MNLIADNPVLRRELRRQLRVRFTSRPWMFGVLIVAGIAVWCYATGVFAIVGMGADAARVWWYITIYALLFLISLYAPAGAAKSITRERERLTWETLALTRLSAAQVLLGKWLAHFAGISWLPAVLLPLALACGVASGGGIWPTAAVYAYIMLNCAFFVAVGLLCSFCLARSPSATAVALLCSGALCLGTGLLGNLLGSLPVKINPFYALMCADRLARGDYGGGDYGGYGNTYSDQDQQRDDSFTVFTSVCFEIAFIVLSFLWMARRYGKPVVR